jgi:dihydroneopterin aldolase
MREQLVIERLEFLGRCGITPEERQAAQPLVADAELDYVQGGWEKAVLGDDIRLAVDYAAVAERIVAVGTATDYALLETMASAISDALLAEFPISRVCLSIRKLMPPIRSVRGSIGVRTERTRLAHGPCQNGTQPPAAFLLDQSSLLPKGTVLDVAAGRGRHALFLAARGFTVEAVDHDQAALAEAAEEARRRNLSSLTVRCLDLETRPDIAKERYEAIIVFFFLFRPLIPLLVHALKPGGVLLYETFLIDNHLRHHHPRRREFCLSHNELLHLTSGLRVLHYEEGEHAGEHGTGSAFTARLAAQKEVTEP